ncbi:hypothetical protein PRUB_a0153 [Pseudoalteromonas rubra]|uniref:Uncharacterized protein n=1 Tax=Pseudoalteromonas rubra TaxID=43658 RepID=A0A8T0C4Z1_9GAMM|nr:hypothetical protein PRUB_a0153 [Pseudoalteromonas rubra]
MKRIKIDTFVISLKKQSKDQKISSKFINKGWLATGRIATTC